MSVLQPCRIMVIPAETLYGHVRRLSALNAVSARSKAKAKISEIDQASDPLVDTFQRTHNYLRISLTERCNLRCFYCMPAEGVELSPGGKLLTDEEVVRLATTFVKAGVSKIRLTGGEPTVRKGISNIIGELGRLRPLGLDSIAMTSNGVALHRKLPELIERGLTHLNLSLDTLDRFKFEIMTRRRGHEAVLRTLDVALASPRMKSVKLNVVVIRGLNDSEVLDFVDLTRNSPLSVRFIEFMPFSGNKWDQQKMVPSNELLRRISTVHPNVVKCPEELNETARSWKIPGHQGTFGFISSMSDHFCATCNRLRLTADGQIKVCLFDAKEISLRDEMRRGASDGDLLALVKRAVLGKHEKHGGKDNIQDIDVVNNRPMILIDSQQKPFRIASHMHSWVQTPTQQSQIRFHSTSASSNLRQLSHLDEKGKPTMVDVSEKAVTERKARASGRIHIPSYAYQIIVGGESGPEETEPDLERRKLKAKSKGDVLTVAQLAGIMAAKRTSDLIPLCHPLTVSNVSVSLTPQRTRIPDGEDGYSILCDASVRCDGKTGVEMEALTAVSVALLTVWDMLKAVAGQDMTIGEIYVTEKSGGRSRFNRP